MRVFMYEFFLPDNDYTLNLCEKLADEADVTIACKRGAARDNPRFTWKPILFEGYKPFLQSLVEYFVSLVRVWYAIVIGHYDVIHAQYFRKAQVEIPFFVLMKRHCKCLAHTVHNVVPHEASPSDKKLYKKIYDACDVLMVHNEYTKVLLMRDFDVPEDKIVVAPIGTYNREPFTEEKHEKIRFVQLGQIRPYKGLDVLIKAVSLLPGEIRNKIEIIVAGKQFRDIDKTDYKRMILECGVADVVKFDERFIPDEEMAALVGNADCCLFPYHHAYGSGSLLLSYAYEKPVIVSDIDVLTEETDNGKTGYVFHTGDAAGLSEAIRKFVQADEKVKAGFVKEIRRLSKERNNWDVSGGKLMKKYKEKCAVPEG